LLENKIVKIFLFVWRKNQCFYTAAEQNRITRAGRFYDQVTAMNYMVVAERRGFCRLKTFRKGRGLHKIIKRKSGKLKVVIDNLANFLYISPNQLSFFSSVCLVPAGHFCYFGFSLCSV
jgi:hypothetical protein